jgi:ribosomal protein S14
MKKIHLKQKDQKLRNNYNLIEKRYFLLKSLQSNCQLPFYLRLKTTEKLNKLKNFSKSRIINRCLITNNSKSVYRPFNLNRNQFKKLATNVELIGVKKSS